MSVIVDGDTYISIEHYMNVKKYEGTLFEQVLMDCKSDAELHVLLTPQIHTYLEPNFLILKKECVMHGTICYFPREDWEDVKYDYFKKYAATSHSSSISYFIYILYESFMKQPIKKVIKKFNIKKLSEIPYEHPYIEYLNFSSHSDKTLFQFLLASIM
jgi:hypothetical protein